MTPNRKSNLADWLCWLERLSPKEIELGLARVEDVLGRLELPRPPRLLTVGGTNGKGSCVALLAEFFIGSGRRVGTYSSPHLIHYCERVCVDGHPISDADMVAAFSDVERVRRDVPLTYFEFGTLAALCAFAAKDVDVVVLEVGLGGRLDAVNAVDPDAVLITNVGMDHMEWLGHDIESIAAEKAGLMRPKKPVVFGGRRLPQAVERVAAELDADLVLAHRDYRFTRGESGHWDWRGRRSTLNDLPPPALAGVHQVENAAAVLALIESLHEDPLLDQQVAAQALRDAALPGRQQTVAVSGVSWLLDGAHNEDGAAALAHTLRQRGEDQAVGLALGVLSDKDADAIIGVLAPEVTFWIACTPDSVRARAALDLGQQIAELTGAPCRVVATVAESLLALAEVTGPNDLRVVAGSFFTVGPALRALEGQAHLGH